MNAGTGVNEEANSKREETFPRVVEVLEAAEISPEVAEKEALEVGVKVTSEDAEIFPEVVAGKEVLEDGVMEDSEGAVNFLVDGGNSVEVVGMEVSEDEVITPEAVAKEVSEAVTVILPPGDFLLKAYSFMPFDYYYYFVSIDHFSFNDR